MSDEKPKAIEGEVLKPESSEPMPAPRDNYQPARRANPIISMLHSYADRRVMEEQTKLKQAMADNIDATTAIAEASGRWAEAEERISKPNLDAMKETVRSEITAKFEKQELELEQLKSERELHGLEHEAKEAELRARIAKAKLEAQRHESRLGRKEKDLDDLIAEAEQKVADVFEEFATQRDEARQAGREITHEEEREFSRKYQAATDRLDELKRRRREQEDDGT